MALCSFEGTVSKYGLYASLWIERYDVMLFIGHLDLLYNSK